MTFRVGQKVVCVDAVATIRNDAFRELREGNIYTVTWVGIWLWEIKASRYSGYLECVALAGIRGPGHMPFAACRFRPVVESKTELPESITKYLDVKNHEPITGHDSTPALFA